MVRIFTKYERVSLIIIFAILAAVAIPNFVVSLRKARDQVRRDDMGALESVLGTYLSEFGAFPLSSLEGKIMNCLEPGIEPYQNELGYWVVDATTCEWGQDSFINLISKRIYMSLLPRDPHWQKGASYLYISDGERYQIFASMEGDDEPEVDETIIARDLKCGERICNIGRNYGCSIAKTLEDCAQEAKDLKK